MPNLASNQHDDTWLIKLFQGFETMMQSRATMDWSITTDFQVFSQYLLRDIRDIQAKFQDPDDEFLYYASEHLFNLLDWIKLIIEDAGFPTFGTAWENLFDKEFGDKHILKHLFESCFDRWLSNKFGQYKIGENFYNIIEGKLYYRNRFNQWFEVDRATAFDLKPNKDPLKDSSIIDRLNTGYRETWYDALLKQWEGKGFEAVLPKDFLEYSAEETSPEEYAEFSVSQLKKLLENPVSINELERWSGEPIADLEHLVKIASFVLKITKKRQNDNSHTLYLLRDCLMFYETQKALDIIETNESSSDQILVGRKLLSNKSGDWGYYAVTLDILYNAHLRYPNDFSEFYNEYARLMDMFVSKNQQFAAIIANITEYVKEHIKTDKKKVVIFDIGFQGSIALLTKYIIDHHISPREDSEKLETDIEIGVGAQWSKKLFGKRLESDYFPMLNRVQLLARSDELCRFKEGSLKAGKLRILMANKKTQRKAAIELVVISMVALLLKSGE